MTTTFADPTDRCPSCGADWSFLDKMQALSIFTHGKIWALECIGQLIEKCDECKKHFGKEG